MWFQSRWALCSKASFRTVIFYAPIAKSDRLAIIRSQKEHNIPALLSELQSMRLWVFGDGAASDSAAVNENWERQKIAEKGRTSAVDGVPLAQPALALAAKLVARVERGGLQVDPDSGDEIGERLFAVVRDAVAAGVDPEGALRRTTLAYREAIKTAEREAIKTAEREAIIAAESAAST